MTKLTIPKKQERKSGRCSSNSSTVVSAFRRYHNARDRLALTSASIKLLTIRGRERCDYVLDGIAQDLRYAVPAAAPAVRTDGGPVARHRDVAARRSSRSPTRAVQTASGVVDAGRLVDVGRSQNGQGFDNGSYPNYLDIRARNTVFTGIFAYRIGAEPMSLGGRDGAERIYGDMVSTNYFSILGTRPHIGRLFTPEDSERPGATPLAVLNHHFWMRRFNGDPGVVGQTLQLNGRPFTVVGVAPEGFHGTTVLSGDVWVPVSMVGELSPRRSASILTSRESVWLVMGARLKSGVSIRQAQAELGNIGRALEQEFPEANRGKGLRVVASSPIPGNGAPVAAFMAVLMGIVTLVLAIACANVAGVLLARASARRREIAVRLAIGAGRGRLVRQMLVESTLLFLVGGGAGLALARVMTDALVSLLPTLPIPVDVTLPLDGGAVAFTLGLSLVAVLSGSRRRFTRQGSRKSCPASSRTRRAVSSGCGCATRCRQPGGVQHRARRGRRAVRACQRAADIDPGSSAASARGARPVARRLHERDWPVFARADRARPRSARRASAALSQWCRSARRLSLGGSQCQCPGRRGDATSIPTGTSSRRGVCGDEDDLTVGRDFTDRDRDGAPLVIIVNSRGTPMVG
jgi:hypothetical protein